MFDYYEIYPYLPKECTPYKCEMHCEYCCNVYYDAYYVNCLKYGTLFYYDVEKEDFGVETKFIRDKKEVQK